MKAVSLELGGRAGYLVDAEHARDFDMIASDIVGAAFGTSGQNCTASSRIIFVGDEPDDFGKFTDALVKAAQDFTVGDPFTDVNMGPVINQRAADRIKNWVEEATKAGAEVLYQGPTVPEEGSWISPTLISEAPAGTTLSTEEVFGLASTIWCEDVARMKWWANQLRVGTVATPFSGLRESGFWGRDNGPEALRNYQETKTVRVAP
nr:aldehyde dehydrogenase family protein [Corynebacterium stationis]